MIEYTPEALRQVDALLLYYEDRQRDGAARALLTALEKAEHRIESDPSAGLTALRPYPRMTRPDRAWLKSGQYCIHHRRSAG